MKSVTIDIPNEENIIVSKRKKLEPTLLSDASFVMEKMSKREMQKVIHSMKAGIALVLVSLLYLLDPLFRKVGEKAMWAIMSVVVVFEFFAGATISKGLNRGVGTIVGGGLGCLAAILADEFGGIGNALVVGTSIFIFGAAATYYRLVPKIKRRYDYGLLIFILTFNLVVVSGVRADKVMELAYERLSTIGMGFAISICTSLLIFPIWASNEFHDLTASKFGKLASCIEECLEEYFTIVSKKETEPTANVNSCKSVLQAKSTEESLANFAKWEPWHGNFGFYYPWEKYLRIGEVLRELAAIILILKGFSKSPNQPLSRPRQEIKEPCIIVGSELMKILHELGESITKMRKYNAKILIETKLKCMKIELSIIKPSTLENTQNDEALAIPSLVFLLMEMTEKVEVLAKEVEELGEIADFQSK